MSDTQSIEDLLAAAGGSMGDDESAQAKFAQKEKEIKIREIEKMTQQKASALGMDYIDLVGFPISQEALCLLNDAEASSLRLICFYYDGKNIRLASPDPSQAEIAAIMRRLEEKYFCHTALYMITDHSFDYAYGLFKKIPKVEKTIRGVKITQDDLDKYSDNFQSFNDLQEEIIKSSQVSEMVNMIIAASVRSNSSDIHIEAEESGIKVRFRIDGILHDVAMLERSVWDKMISRLKLLAGVKINVNDKPQDGRMSIFLTAERIDVRISFLPTSFGESVVMRLLRSSSVGLNFEDLGILGSSFERLKREVERPNGMIITTGPTGSGKTTTLYAILKKLNNTDTKIITIEDPIEYQLKGVNQSQIGKNYTFAQGLRSIVRQDPDVIMVGEIRDLETAEVAIQAALTGHLVLSTIHTNDAAGTIPRFLSMGVKPFLLAPALNAMIGQRLVRRICPDCKREAVAEEKYLARAKELLGCLPDNDKRDIDLENLKFYEGAGCSKCQNIGFRGQIGIYEIINMNAEIEKQILSGNVSEYDMRDNAAKHGMVSMAQDGVLKALKGITSLDEVFRVAE